MPTVELIVNVKNDDPFGRNQQRLTGRKNVRDAMQTLRANCLRIRRLNSVRTDDIGEQKNTARKGIIYSNKKIAQLKRVALHSYSRVVQIKVILY
jgi:hypothetical protein